MSEQTAPVIELNDLTKKFGSITAVDGVNLSIPSGKIYGLIGPNGAGKTTLLKMLVGLLTPTKGSIQLNGIHLKDDPQKAKEQFAYISDDPSGYDFLSGKEFLVMSGKLRNMHPADIEAGIEKLLPLFPLSSIFNQRMATYSRGNREKIVYLASLLVSPKLLIIDEPLVGLDPKSITTLGTSLQAFAKSGGTVVITTHILEFVQTYADTIGLLIGGKLVVEKAWSREDDLNKLYETYTDITTA